MNNEAVDFKKMGLLKELVEYRLKPWEVKVVQRFFYQRTFSPRGEIEIYKLLLSANDNKKPIRRVIKHCRGEWKTNWSQQHHTIRGDTNHHPVRALNIISLEHIYGVVGLPAPSFNCMANETIQLG